MTDVKMTSNRPYLIRALYQWLLDNQCTPHVVVDAKDARVRVPQEFIKDGQIVLNISPSAVGQFSWDDDCIVFSARFGGVPRRLEVPMWAVLAIYARENGEGMAFGPAQAPMDTQEVSFEIDVGKSPKAQTALKSVPDKKTPRTSKIKSLKSENELNNKPDNDPTPTKPSTKKRAGLRVVK